MLIVSIDTSTENASVCITNNEVVIGFAENKQQKEHSTFLHNAVKGMLLTANQKLTNIDAFAVTSGPGSYTGLRVGMAAAKGFCYALKKPLIAVNTLEVMTLAAKKIVSQEERFLFCPMIDARRMEVFTALYNEEFDKILPPQPIVLSDDFLSEILKKETIVFFGSGSRKFKHICLSQNCRFLDITFNATNLSEIAHGVYKNANFTEVIYAEPNYFKGFYSTN